MIKKKTKGTNNKSVDSTKTKISKKKRRISI